MQHHTITFLPDNKSVRIHSGATLLEAAGQADIVLVSPCGGRGFCKKCRLRIEPSGQEVVACQTRVLSDMTISIPSPSRYYTHQILEHGIGQAVDAEPVIRKFFLPGIAKDIPAVEHKLRLAAGGHIHHIDRCNPNHLQKPEGITAIASHRDTCPAAGKEAACFDLLGTEAGPTSKDLYGVAADIGTTTVVAYLLDLHTGDTKATASQVNPQHRYGDDVISRIEHGSTQEGLQALHQTIIGCLNELIVQLCRQASISPQAIYELVAVGNTTMNHLLLKLPVVQLGQSPYRPYSVAAHQVIAPQISLNINPAGRLHTPENIAGFVGSDTLAAAVAANFDIEHRSTLLVDIGTNGEIILCHKGHYYAASCAAGPAMEGARILHGGRAVPGAIQRILVNKSDIDIDIIGQGEPKSICGSGLIDALAVLIELQILDSTGRFKSRSELQHLPPAILSRLTDYQEQPAFIFARPANHAPIVFTQQDVRHLQLAKAAIRAGIKILHRQAQLDEQDIKQILLAGAFGNYIQKASAVRIGLLPNVPLEKIHFIGNAAGSGAMMLLLNGGRRQVGHMLAQKTEYVELAANTAFESIFAESLMFETD